MGACSIAQSRPAPYKAMDCSPIHGQPPLLMEFPRQEYWNGLLFPPPGDRPYPGIEPMSPALAGRFFTILPLGKPLGQSRAPQIRGGMILLDIY